MREFIRFLSQYVTEERIIVGTVSLLLSFILQWFFTWVCKKPAPLGELATSLLMELDNYKNWVFNRSSYCIELKEESNNQYFLNLSIYPGRPFYVHCNSIDITGNLTSEEKKTLSKKAHETLCKLENENRQSCEETERLLGRAVVNKLKERRSA